mmetsp:Transcript_119337/g.337592  ORF Transcript_119337/g.337592 Transcript_119337/m.337592 type:complete len:247 (+) Transcript_119337:373-1113(+)
MSLASVVSSGGIAQPAFANAASSASASSTLFAQRSSLISLCALSSSAFRRSKAIAVLMSLSTIAAIPKRNSHRADSASRYAIPMRSFLVLGLGTFDPSSFVKKGGARSSGGASLSLSAPNSASMRWRLSIFLIFFFSSDSIFLTRSSALSRSARDLSALVLASAASSRAFAASACASAQSDSALACASKAAAFSFKACSFSFRASLIFFLNSSLCLSASRCFFLASSMRLTCSATICFAFSSSPSS